MESILNFRDVTESFNEFDNIYNKNKTFLYFAFCQKHQAIKLMGEVLAPNGLHGMYIDLVKNCHEIIIEILEVLTDKSNLPVLIHCKHGKDRTGIVIAIILSLLGIPDELIIKDYLSSLKHLQPIQSEIVKDFRRMGLPEEFSLMNIVQRRTI
nr:840_t:CDS:2 [Entrophospora candida]